MILSLKAFIDLRVASFVLIEAMVLYMNAMVLLDNR